MNRRAFVASSTAFATAAMKPNIQFGVDLFSIRNSNYTAFEYLDHCAKLGAEVVHFSELRFLGGLEAEHLKKVRDRKSVV